MSLLVSQKELTFQEGSTLGVIMIFTCVLSWAISSLFVAQADLPKNFFITTGYQMLLAGIVLCVASLVIGETWISPLDWTFKTNVAMVCLVLFGSIAAFTSFNYLLKTVSTEKVATAGYVNPIIALILGWQFLNEQISTQTIGAAALLLLGVYFINNKKDKTA
jgi:drug/metabolite transporter (DMT)-like permease